MAIDRQFIGYRMSPFEVLVEAERVRRFIRAIGAPMESIPAGCVPPTFLKVIEGEGNSSRRLLDALGVNLQRVLHAEQEFEFGDPVRVGDRLIVERVVTDIFERKNGSLEFIVVDSSIRRNPGQWVGRSRQSILVRNPRMATSS
jgi:N-terminal half of MaoC dehydratase